MSEIDEFDRVIDELIRNIANKLNEQQNEIDKLKIELNEIKTHKAELKLIGQVAEQKNEQVAEQNTQIDLTQLPAYAKTDIFKEIRRPININELYMMVLQSQRTINELQMNIDNICRRN